MSFWKRWFGKPSPAARKPIEKVCPYCGREAAGGSRSAVAYPVWDCECGAIGSGSPMYPDLDEVADGLLAVLGIGGSVRQPSSPVGESGIVSLQPYDIPQSLGQLEHILREHGYEIRPNTLGEAERGMYTLWVRRSS